LSDRSFEEMLADTLEYWRRWVSRCTYEGRWREVVHRSALVLKLMVYDPSGALVAAPTMGLPEWVGGVRNWDYRYTWLRDASFALYALISIGFDERGNSWAGFTTAATPTAQTACSSPSTGLTAASDSRRPSSRTSPAIEDHARSGSATPPTSRSS
jgi:GH15 family glucan-1,4-alpha-glucosidase